LPSQPRHLYGILKEAFQAFLADNAIQLAAALSFYAVTALPPLLVALAHMVGWLVSGSNEEYLLNQAGWLLGSSSMELLRAVLAQSREGGEEGIALAGFLFLLIGASGFFVQLQDALNLIWKVRSDHVLNWKEKVVKRVLSLAVVLSTGIIVLLSVLASAVLGAAGEEISTRFGVSLAFAKSSQFVVSLALLTAVFALLFKLLPDAKISWGHVWSGAVLTALMFSASKGLFGWFLEHAQLGIRYGPAGALVILLFWIDFACLIFLFGAEWTRVIDRRQKSGLGLSPGRRTLERQTNDSEDMGAG